MKEYNRKTKRWEEPTGLGKFKARDLCKGHKEHDYILALPNHFSRAGVITDEIKPEAIAEYYASEERRRAFEEEEEAKLLALGLNLGRGRWRHTVSKFYRCVVCGKQKYE